MVLDRHERVVRTSGISYTLIIAAAAFIAITLAEVTVNVPMALLLLFLSLLVVLWTLLGTTEVLLTCSRVVQYRPLLARLARRFPAVRPVEAERRRTFELDAIQSAYASRDELVLQTATERVRLQCHDAQTAFDMAFEIEAQVRRRTAETVARIEARRRSERLQAQLRLATTVSASSTGATRCVYCHGDLDPDEQVIECDRCGAAHHEDCLAVHGKCAVLACGGGAKVRT